MSELDRAEQAFTGRAWKDCPACHEAGHQRRILAEYPSCQEHGGPLTNCRTCGTGVAHAVKTWRGTLKCLVCEGDPAVAGSGRADYEDYSRANMIRRFGPRMPGDAELLARYFPAR
jgi:hypothetical protein